MHRRRKKTKKTNTHTHSATKRFKRRLHSVPEKLINWNSLAWNYKYSTFWRIHYKTQVAQFKARVIVHPIVSKQVWEADNNNNNNKTYFTNKQGKLIWIIIHKWQIVVKSNLQSKTWKQSGFSHRGPVSTLGREHLVSGQNLTSPFNHTCSFSPVATAPEIRHVTVPTVSPVAAVSTKLH